MSETGPTGRRLPRLYAVRQITEQTGLPASTVYDLIAEGELQAVRIGRSVRVDERDFLRWLEARREVAA